MKSPIVRAALLAAAISASSHTVSAAWTILNLPDTINWGNTAMGHLADGRFVYGHTGTMLAQNTFGSNATSSYVNAPAGDYAFLTSKYFGSGSWGGGPVASYNSSNLSTTFATIGSHQSYDGANYSPTSLLIVGLSGGNSSLFHVTDGNATTTVISNISTYSGGFALSGSGDVYIADDDDLNLYRFTSAQITGAIGGSPLTVANGTLLGNLGVSGSLAYDSVQNRLYAAGWQLNGIQFLDLDDMSTGSLVPGPANTNYKVMTFSDGTNQYVGWLNRSGFVGGDTVLYGYDLAANVIPEPTTLAFLALAGGILLVRGLRLAVVKARQQ